MAGSIMRRIVATSAALVVAAGLAVVGSGSVAAAPVTTAANVSVAAPACPTVKWGSTVKKKKRFKLTNATVDNVRVGSHRCYDRVVVDLGPGKKTGYQVKYVKTVRQDGSGFPVSLKGGASLRVIIPAAAYDIDSMKSTLTKAEVRKANRKITSNNFRTVKEVAFAGSFEGQTTLGIGVRARLPFTVKVLDGPGKNHRLVIDIARTW